MKPDLKGSKKYRQGVYALKHPEKYVGDPTTVYFRSNLERRYFKHFDENPDIIKWASEEIAIPYTHPIDKRIHRYFVDVTITTRAGRTFMIEIKPDSQTVPPKGSPKSKRYARELIEYHINDAKWTAARKFCRDRNMEFQILTEKNIKAG